MKNSCKLNLNFPTYPMFTLCYLLFFIFNSLTIIISSNLLESYNQTEVILLNCGTSGNSIGPDGRKWTGDIGSSFSSSQQFNDSKIVSKALSKASSIDAIPYMAAQIFRSPFTYSFQVSPGQKFIRLYFYSTTYQEFDRSSAFFTVTVGPFTVLDSFNASLTADSSGSESFVKEFCVNIQENQSLNITFTPSPSPLDDTYAFVNGIEIVSLPTNLYYNHSGDTRVPFVGKEDQFFIKNSTVLELVHRLNAGGSSISPTNDSGLFRRWSKDTKLLLDSSDPLLNSTIQINYTRVAASTAPAEVYQTARSIGKGNNLTWVLPVDSGSKYLVRLHFCEIQPEITKSGDRKFRISFNNQTAETSADIIAWSGGNGIPVYKDYVVLMPNEGTVGKTSLFIILGPNSKSRTASFGPILNGLELFKLRDLNYNLAGTSPESFNLRAPAKRRGKQAKKSKKFKNLKKNLIAISGATFGSVTVLLLLSFCIFWQWRREKFHKASVLPVSEGLCRRFTLEELRTATDNFDRNLVIGDGGFGRVYKGSINNKETPVAIKVMKPESRQGYREFHTEIEMLSTLRHPNLVSLIGYCNDEGTMIIVYDYMVHGTLRDHLYNTDNPPLSWKQRLEICIGAARGLKYLHAGAKDVIIHRDIKSSNILLDEKWVAKVSDFGLSRLGPANLSSSHVTTEARGTFGYLDPEYYLTSHLTVKSDVYSFGVVLFEVLCARPAVAMELEEEQHSLAWWAKQCVEDGTFDQIMDSHLTGKIARESLQVYVKIASKCLREHRNDRPKMAHVLKKLELALELQERADAAAEAHLEQISLCGSANQVVSRPWNKCGLVQSCPASWHDRLSHKEPVLRFFSEKVGVRVASPPTFRGLKAFLFAVSAYVALPRQHEHMIGPDVSATPAKVLVELMNTEVQ